MSLCRMGCWRVGARQSAEADPDRTRSRCCCPCSCVSSNDQKSGWTCLKHIAMLVLNTAPGRFNDRAVAHQHRCYRGMGLPDIDSETCPRFYVAPPDHHHWGKLRRVVAPQHRRDASRMAQPPGQLGLHRRVDRDPNSPSAGHHPPSESGCANSR